MSLFGSASKKYPGESNYGFVSGNPIINADKEGKDKIITMTIIGRDGMTTQIRQNDKSYFKYGTYHREGGIGYYFWRSNVHQDVTIDLRNNTATVNTNDDDRHQYISAYNYSKLSDLVKGVENFFNSKDADLSKTFEYGIRIYSDGTDTKWQSGLPTIVPGSDESIDLKEFLEIAGGIIESDGSITLSDLGESFGSKKHCWIC